MHELTSPIDSPIDNVVDGLTPAKSTDKSVPSHFIRNLQVLGRRLENGQLDWKTFVLEVSAKVQIHCATHDFSPGAGKRS